MQYPTYRDLCVKVLTRIGEEKNVVGGSITQTTTIAGYLKAIPGLLADALSYLQTAARFVRRSLELVVVPAANLLDSDFSIQSGDRRFEAAGVQSYFIELAGPCSLSVWVGGERAVDLAHGGAGFAAYRGNLANPGGLPVAMEVRGDAPFLSRCAALYRERFEADSDVPAFSQWRRFDLSELAPDFWELNERELLQESGATNITSEPASRYRWESTRTLLLDNTAPGAYRVHYFAYPQHIPSAIADSEVLYLDPEIYALAPLYIEGKLRLMADEDYAATLLNEFEARRAELAAGARVRATAKVLAPLGGAVL